MFSFLNGFIIYYAMDYGAAYAHHSPLHKLYIKHELQCQTKITYNPMVLTHYKKFATRLKLWYSPTFLAKLTDTEENMLHTHTQFKQPCTCSLTHVHTMCMHTHT